MKTNNAGLALIIFMVVLNIIAVGWLFHVKGNLKECESLTSTNCPIFTCEHRYPSKSIFSKCNFGGSSKGSRPWRCKTNKENCAEEDVVCMSAIAGE